MDPSNFPDAGEKIPTQQKTQLQIQGPRPPPLSIHKCSHKIKKPPKPPLPLPKQPHHDNHRHEPIIIYAISPKIINVAVSDFMATVQRLTGVSSDDFTGAGGDVSPAARLASVEKFTSPKGKSSTRVSSSGSSSIVINDELIIEEKGAEPELGRVPGILSPATLPPVVQEMYFSPMAAAAAADPFGFSVLHGNGGLWASSPSGLFSSLVSSPILSPDIFGQIWNF